MTMRSQEAQLGGLSLRPPIRLDTSTKIAVNAARPTSQPARNARPVGLRPRRVQHQHRRDDRQRRERDHQRQGDELGQHRSPTLTTHMTPALVANVGRAYRQRNVARQPSGPSPRVGGVRYGRGAIIARSWPITAASLGKLVTMSHVSLLGTSSTLRAGRPSRTRPQALVAFPTGRWWSTTPANRVLREQVRRSRRNRCGDGASTTGPASCCPASSTPTSTSRRPTRRLLRRRPAAGVAEPVHLSVRVAVRRSGVRAAGGAWNSATGASRRAPPRPWSSARRSRTPRTRCSPRRSGAGCESSAAAASRPSARLGAAADHRRGGRDPADPRGDREVACRRHRRRRPPRCCTSRSCRGSRCR